jgi:hypothetical protein
VEKNEIISSPTYLTKIKYNLLTQSIHDLASFGGCPIASGSHVISYLTANNGKNPHAQVG